MRPCVKRRVEATRAPDDKVDEIDQSGSSTDATGETESSSCHVRLGNLRFSLSPAVDSAARCSDSSLRTRVKAREENPMREAVSATAACQKLLIASVLCVAFLTAPAAVRANLLTNGSFETPSVPAGNFTLFS